MVFLSVCTGPVVSLVSLSLVCARLLHFFQALNDAKRELRFLLVYLHSSDHQDTEEFCR